MNNRRLPLEIVPDKAEKTNSIPDKLYFRISEVSKLTELEPYILRYWETEFRLLKPIRTKSKHRLYKRKDVCIILEIKRLLYDQQFTIAGAKKRLEEIVREEKNEDTANEPGDFKKVILDTLEELKSIRKFLAS
ncbi:MAG: MerR family transcriptional regulator [Deltaproteobacteria bacterium]|nr:MerR family transcriptional regulator [Deltaproteobacteria bacterium]